jgi:hypothetical protein
MSYENTACPCGGKKERETMICADCEQHFAATIEIATVQKKSWPMEVRRNAAIRLLAMARRRNKRLPLAFLE